MANGSSKSGFLILYSGKLSNAILVRVSKPAALTCNDNFVHLSKSLMGGRTPVPCFSLNS